MRPLLNDPRSYPHFSCPNCRAATDLEADVDEPTSETWEENNDDEPSPDTSTAEAMNGIISHEGEEGMHETSDTPAGVSSAREENHLQPHLANLPDPFNDPSPGLLNRREARRISPPFVPISHTPAHRQPSNQSQYLRPITPTQPLMGDESTNGNAPHTPPADGFTQDGPMTPTNNAGPFVFDGSAGRVVGRTDVDVMSETGDNHDR